MSRRLGSEAEDCATIDDVGRAILYESSAAQIASAPEIGPGSWKFFVSMHVENFGYWSCSASLVCAGSAAAEQYAAAAEQYTGGAEQYSTATQSDW